MTKRSRVLGVRATRLALLVLAATATLRVAGAGVPAPHEKWVNSLKPRGVPGPELVLASQGKTRYTILLPETPATQDVKAAKDLAETLGRITGASFPVVSEGAPAPVPAPHISIGQTGALGAAAIPGAAKDLGRDGYAILVQGENLYLIGGSRRGPIHAVYCLLEEDLGCRWYDGSPDSALVPRIPELRLQPVPRAYVPQFEEMRWILVWEAKAVNFSLWNRSMDCDLYRDFPKEWGGIDTLSGIHTLPSMVPAEEYFREHPEYFSMIDGKRVPGMICMSNHDVFEIILRQALDSEYPMVMLSSRDGPAYCACPACRAVIDAESTPGAPQLALVNRIAAEVAKVQPEKRIVFLAYQSTAKPPRTIRPHGHVLVLLCADAHGFGPATLYLTQTPRLQEYLAGWEALGAKILIWEYVTNFGTGMHLSPLPNLTVVGRDIRFLAQHRCVAGILLQGCLWGRGDRGRLRSWVWAKQTWNPSLNTDDLVRDFTYGYYGKAAEPVIRYNELLRHTWDEWHKSLAPLDKKRGASPPLGDDFVAGAAALFAEARELAADDPALASRVEDAEVPVRFQQLLNGLPRAENRTNPLPADDGYWQSVDHLRDYCSRRNTGLVGRYDVLARAEAARKGEDERSVKQVLDSKYGRVFVETLSPVWKFKPDPEKTGVKNQWYAKDADDAAWGIIRTDLGAGWGAQGYPNAADSFGWYRQRAFVSDDTNPWRDDNWYLLFEAVDEDAHVYVNGIKVVEHACDSTGLAPEVIWETPFMVNVNGVLAPGGNNLLAVGVYNRKMMGGIWKPVHVLACKTEIDDLHAVLKLLKD